MLEWCIDASVAVKWVLRDEMWRKKARRLLYDSIMLNISLIAPPLFEYETDSVLQERLYFGKLTVTEADTAIEKLNSIGVQIVNETNMIKCARDIARCFNQTKIYDSAYAALAQIRGCEFWTADKVFYDAVKSTLPFIKYLTANY
ncbi:MAG: type II toxin-antitoxin system VapC family toxin [Candidatus Poribacteria bacterium]